MAKRQGVGNWLMYGCFGCLGLAAFLVLIVVGLAGIAYLQVGSEEMASESITPDLPAFALAPGSPELAEPAPERRQLPAGSGLENLEETAAGQGKVFLEVNQAGLNVEPGRPGEPLRVEASYDKKAYTLEEALETAEDGTWTYRVNFSRTGGGGGFMASLRQWMGGTSPKVRIFLPPDMPLDLEAESNQGSLEMELGGLWLRTATVKCQQGGAEVVFSEPLRRPMESLSVNGSMGGFALVGVGKASPERLDVGFSMGGAFVDLRGPWQNDAEIHMSASMGGGEVRLPPDLPIEGLEPEWAVAQPSAEIPSPTLRFQISESSRKSLEFDR